MSDELEIPSLHVPFREWLRESGIYAIYSRSDRESTINEGHPDFTLLLLGHALLIEFKTDKGKLSTAQKKCHMNLQAAGNRVHVVRSMDTAVELVNAWRGMIRVDRTEGPVNRLVIVHSGVFRQGPSGNLYSLRSATQHDLLTLPRLK